jgi:hypothetical protein
MRTLLLAALAAAVVATAPAQAASRKAPPTGHVVVNGVPLPAAVVGLLERRLRLRIADGAYWYDRVSGAFGVPAGPTAGFLPAGLPLPGPVAANASAGRSGVFVNGRELAAVEVRALARLFGSPIPRGRFWLDGRGNYGREGGRALGNLIRIAHARGAYQQSTYGGYIGSDGRTSYYLDDRSGCSVVPGEGLSC